MDKNKKLMLGAGIGILVVLILCVCVLGIIGFIYREPILALLGFGPSQNVARMLPENTQFYASANPNLQNVPGYQNIKKLYLDNPDIKALLDEFESEVKEEANFTFEDDIKPWLGTEVVVAVPDFASVIENPSGTPGLVIAAQTTDPEASDKFIQKMLDRGTEEDNPFAEEVYQEVTLHIQKNEFTDEVDTVVATFNDFVFVASSDTLMKNMIDQAQGNTDNPSLADSERFQRVTGELPSETVMTVYLDPSSIFDAAFEESGLELPEESLQDLKAFETMAIGGTLQPDGLQLDVVATFDVEKMSEQMKASLEQPASPNAILNDIPADALFSYNAHNLSKVWQQAKKGLESNPDFQEGLQDLEEELGFSIEEDVFSWMTGEFAIVLLEVSPPDEFSPPLGGYTLIGTDDVDNARSRVDKVVGSFEEQGMLPPLETQTIGDVEMKVFTNFNGEVQGGYGFYSNYFLLAYLEDSVKAVTAASQSPLTSSDNFKAVQSRLPEKNYGYFYADLDRIQQVVEKQLSDFDREEYDKNVRPFLTPAHALGVAGNPESVEQGMSKAVVFVLISE